MSLTSVVKHAVGRGLRYCGYEVHAVPREPSGDGADPVVVYDRQGRQPWVGAFEAARRETVRRTLSSEPLMAVFRNGAPLPDGFGIGLDERCVEYPWALSRIPDAAVLLLDAGSALNHVGVLNALLRPDRRLHIVTLAPEEYRMADPRVSYFYGDLRDFSFVRDGAYDAIACVSTLEHVGMDNTAFARALGAPAQDGEPGASHALMEMWRVLRPGGCLLITMPFGRRHDFGTFLQYDREMVTELVRSVPDSEAATTYFHYQPSGWRLASADECQDAEYVPWCMQPKDRRPPVPPQQPDRAAAARAVVCIELTKRRTDTTP